MCVCVGRGGGGVGEGGGGVMYGLTFGTLPSADLARSSMLCKYVDITALLISISSTSIPFFLSQPAASC